jgi:hypothetical protein
MIWKSRLSSVKPTPAVTFKSVVGERRTAAPICSVAVVWSVPGSSAPSRENSSVSCWLKLKVSEVSGLTASTVPKLNPNSLPGLTRPIDLSNRLVEALRCLDLVLQRDPYAPNNVCEVRGQTLSFLKRHEEAIAALRNMRAEYFWTHMFLAASFAQSGQSADARRELNSFLMAKPKASLDSVSQTLDYADDTMRDYLLEGLCKAGLPK